MFLILLTSLFALPAHAQSERSATRDAAVSVESRQLRFASRRPVEHMRLQVLDRAGALIHDSGLVAKNDLVWSPGDDKGNALKGGLYDWMLTVKEPGEPMPRVKRGQFNLENTNELDSAGPSASAPVVAGGSGTVGVIPKWITTTDLGDSVIIEDGGNVAIGTTPGGIIRLRVFLKPPNKNAHETIQATLTESFHDDPVNDDLDGQTTGSAVAGFATNTVGGTNGVKGVSYSKQGIGVLGSATNERGKTFGVKGISQSQTGTGVYGIASDTTGVNYGVKGESASPNGYAGFFVGNVNVTGNLSKGSGSFKIDHPLDPENKYLSHSFVESPDMMNIYNGIVTLGKDGMAEVTLPEWFEALNREFRYQLTCIGGFAPVYIAKKVSGNRFKIAGGQPGMEVSWQLTGVRRDAYAESNRILVEELKPAEERGFYLHPEAFGKSAQKSVQPANEKARQR
jgi:hypothetical protein